jgi:hypothetical protein
MDDDNPTFKRGLGRLFDALHRQGGREEVPELPPVDTTVNILLVAFDPVRLAERHEFRKLMGTSFPLMWCQLPGIAIVRTPLTSPELRDMLKPTLAEDDELLIVTLEPGGWVWRGNTADGVEWLRKNA